MHPFQLIGSGAKPPPLSVEKAQRQLNFNASSGALSRSYVIECKLGEPDIEPQCDGEGRGDKKSEGG